MSEVGEPVTQIVLVKVALRVHTEEVIQIDLVCVVILLVIEIELIGHLVGEVESLLACSLVTHCRCADHCGQCCYQCQDVTFHSLFLLVFWCKGRVNPLSLPRFFPILGGEMS